MKHKLWKLCVALCLCALALAGISAQAKAKEAIASGEWGTCPWEISDAGVLTVHPGTGQDTNYANPWSEYSESITSVVFAAEGGQKVIAPADSSTLLADLPKVESIDCSGLDTSGVTSMAYMFRGCASLTSLDVSTFDTANVTSMYQLFCECASLSALDLSSFDTGSASAQDLFYGCDSLKSLTLGEGFVLPLETDFFTGEQTETRTGLSGAWKAASDGSLYSAAAIMRRGVAETYTLDESLIAIGEWGTCPWEIASDGTLTVHPGTGAEQEPNWGTYESPWASYSEHITKVIFAAEGGQKVIAPANSRSLLASLIKAESIDLSGLDTSNVTDMASMFSCCVALTSLDLSGFDTERVTDMSGMFSCCMALTSLDPSGFDTGGVTDMSGMFSGCASLGELDLTSFDTSNVTSMRYMFGTFNAVMSGLPIGYPTYVSCSSLAYLDLSSFDTTNVLTMNSMFAGADALKTFKVGAKFIEPSGEYSDGWSYEQAWSVPDGAWVAASDGRRYYGETLARRGVADTYTRDESVYTIGMWGTCPWEIGNDGTLTVHPGTGAEPDDDIFASSKSPWIDFADRITAIVFAQENGQKVIAPTNCSHLFYNLGNVVTIDLSGLDTSRATDMSYMFSCGDWCDSSLESVNLSSFSTSNVTSMRGMFQGCERLASLDLSGFDTRCVTDMSGMFGGYYSGGGEGGIDTQNSGCATLASLDLSNFDTSRVTTMANMFYGCTSLTSLDISSFDTSNVTDMSVMFKGCASLGRLDLSNFDTSHVTSFCAQQASGMSDYYEGMFEGCESLVSLDVSGFDTSGVSVLDFMFSGCASLSELDLSSWDTSKVTTMVYMFRGCSALKTIYVSELWNLESIVEYSSLFSSSGTGNMFGTERYWANNEEKTGYCVSLVGGNGTAFDAEHTDGEYARIDTTEAPGYFTYKAAPAPVHAPGWAQEGGVWRYYGTDGKAYANRWLNYGGAWYYFGADGAAYANRWLSYDGAWYRFGDNGKCLASQWLKIDGSWYYFGSDGKAYASQWLNYGGAWYYFGADGKVYVSQWLNYGGAWYYFGADGKVYVSQWLNYGGAWYYFGSDGKAYANKWLNYGGSWYWFGANGKAVSNTWVEYEGTWYHFNGSGACDGSWKAA